MSVDEETQEISACFLDESIEAFDEIEPLLMQLETALQSDNTDEIDEIFRVFHSVKGSAEYLKYTSIQRVTHSVEGILQQLRDGRLLLDRDIIQALCATVDYLRGRLAAVEETLSDAGDETRGEDLVRQLDAIATMNRMPFATDDPTERALIDSELGDGDDTPRVLFSMAFDGDSVSVQDAGPVEAQAGGSLSDSVLAHFVGKNLSQLAVCELALHRVMADQKDVASLLGAMRALHDVQVSAGRLHFHDLQALVRAIQSTLERVLRGESKRSHRETVSTILTCMDAARVALRGPPEEPPRIGELSAKIAGMEALMHDSASDTRLGKILVDADFASESELEQALFTQTLDGVSGVPVGEVLIDKVGLHPQDLEDALAHQRAKRMGENPPPLSKPRARKKHETLRVDLDKLDTLMDLVSELVVETKDAVEEPNLDTLQRDGSDKSSANLGRIVRDLQDVAMTLRMVPVDVTFRKMMRVVRDVSRKRGKEVRLETFGGETEVDKTVAESITAPLVHLLRNAVDHGIEPAEDRIAAGKAEVGTIRLAARHQGGEIWITVQDDGGGLDAQRIYDRARERGLTTRSYESHDRQEILDFIFEPGFSTAAFVSDISGRGVGMDVARRNIERIRGRIEVASEPGEGTVLSLRIPLTMSVIDGTLVKSGSTLFTIPRTVVKESIVPSMVKIDVPYATQEVVNLHTYSIPILRLHAFYDIADAETDLEKGVLLVVEDGEAPICLFVDEVIGDQRTMIRSLDQEAAGGLAGSAILDDGTCSHLLDVAGLQVAWSRGAA